MALSLGVRVGSEIKVGDSVVRIKDIRPPCLIVLSVDGGEDVVVSDQSRTEILPEVWVFTGAPANPEDSSSNRLAFQAPRRIKILRDMERHSQ